MYVVVYSLRNAGLTDLLASVIQSIADQGLLRQRWGWDLSAAIISSIMNNMPTVMIDALAIDATNTSNAIKEALIYARMLLAPI